MPDCTLDSIAQILTADLAAGHTTGANGGAISLPGNPARLTEAVTVAQSWWPVLKTKELTADVTYVTVMPLKEEGNRMTRTGKLVEYSLTLATIRKLSPEITNAKVSAAMFLNEQLMDFAFDYGLSTELGVWDRDEVLLYPDHSRIKSEGVLFALWDVVFKGTRQQVGT